MVGVSGIWQKAGYVQLPSSGPKVLSPKRRLSPFRALSWFLSHPLYSLFYLLPPRSSGTDSGSKGHKQPGDGWGTSYLDRGGRRVRKKRFLL